MGKSLELLGLAAFNIFIAIILSANFLAKGNERVTMLTENNITQFIHEVAEVSGGKRDDMDSYKITDYFMNHIAEQSMFKSTIEFTLPEMESSNRTMEMGKLDFISNVLQGVQSMDKHETAVTIDYIKIANNGKSAKVTTTNYERGVMPVQNDYGETEMMPVTGTSYCEQELVIDKNKIQMAGADCSTNIDFSQSY